MNLVNQVKIHLKSRSSNESFARNAAAMFAAQLDPTIEEIADIKTAVSEAVTNAIVHGYKDGLGDITVTCSIFEGGVFVVKIRDSGVGIEDVKLALTPTYTTDTSGERSGLGFSVMEMFMDKVRVTSKIGRGTTVTLEKRLSAR